MPILNTKLLLRVLAVVIVLGGALVVLHRVQAGRVPDSLLWQANAAADKGKTDKAIFYLRQYLEFRPDDHDTAIQAIKWEVASKLDPIQLPFIAEPKMKVGEPYIRREDIPIFEEAWNRGGKEALIEAVPDSYVEGMTASGTPDEVRARVQKFRDVGVQLPILRPAAAHQTERLLDLFAPAKTAAPASA